MSYLSIGFYVAVVYGAFVLLAELLIWRFHLQMDGGVHLAVHLRICAEQISQARPADPPVNQNPIGQKLDTREVWTPRE